MNEFRCIFKEWNKGTIGKIRSLEKGVPNKFLRVERNPRFRVLLFPVSKVEAPNCKTFCSPTSKKWP